MSAEHIPVRSAERRPPGLSLTNDTDAICKRSVERLHFPKEPSYLRHFVKKPQRKSALSNRCYWLRLKAIDIVVRRFLEQPSSGKKIVVNLGCGNDVLPWRCSHRYPEACKDVLFVDVDRRDLLRQKRSIVLGAAQLHEILGPHYSVTETEDDPILLKSLRYYQVAFESSNLKRLQTALDSIFSLWPDRPKVLFIADASIPYMEESTARDLLQWARSAAQADFCLLEPVIPLGPTHFFAEVLRKHQGESRGWSSSIDRYPNVSSQAERFKLAGWDCFQACDLWEAWESDKFTTKDERLALDKVEPFDEWEDFMLWCRHHVLVHASTNGSEILLPRHEELPIPQPRSTSLEQRVHKKPIKRRFGGVAVRSDFEGRRYGMHLFGSDVEKAPDTYDLYTSSSPKTVSSITKLPLEGPPPRTCSTLTDLGDYGHLLVGGRTASDKACADCWVLTKAGAPSWKKVQDLPVPVFRHSTVRIKETSLALVLGGKTNYSEVLRDIFIFHPEQGWLKCKCDHRPSATFGATSVAFETSDPEKGVFNGVLFGGLFQNGTLNQEAQQWTLDLTADEPSISFHPVHFSGNQYERLSVFGAQATEKERNIVVCGGMGATSDIQGQSLIRLYADGDGKFEVEELVPEQESCKWPVMIGHSVASDERSIHIFGGGATCFPFGNTWQTSSCSIKFEDLGIGTSGTSTGHPRAPFEYRESPKILPQTSNGALTRSSQVSANITKIPRVRLRSHDEFQRLLRDGKPVIIEAVNVGECVRTWTPSYMAEKVGHGQEVVVHECQTTEKMDFNSKNFQYITDTFASIMTRIEGGGKLYLRSLSNSKPSESPARIEEDFPGLAEDFALPDELAFVKENIFSSVLRISGRVNMWLHYDVMANIYTQIRGSKRMILFPPSDVSHLSFAPGASSSSLDVFSALNTPALSQTRPYEATLGPGDMLLLPPMWFHTATPTSEMSVAVNIFFRDLKDGYSSGRDVYGNRDLAAYEKARQDAARIGKSFEKLPGEIRKFYLARIADELRGMAEGG